MYVAYWNLRERPFQNIADPRFAYLSEQQREGLARLIYVVEERKLGGVLAGPYGVGKTMILELLAEKIRERTHVTLIQLDAPPSNTMALARQILLKLGSTAPVYDTSQALNGIQEHLVDTNPPPHLVIIIDEAQLLRDQETFEFLHLLCNMRVRHRDGSLGDNGITLILSGHQNLNQQLAADTSLSQRLQFFWQLDPLDERQTVEYIQHRMRSAGGDVWTFDEAALADVYVYTQGLPRLINNLCDVALLIGCASGADRITPEIVRQAAREIQAPLAQEATPPEAT